MQISIKTLGKRYKHEWIFRKLNLALEVGAKCAVTGQNGAGKSTFLQILSGFLSPTEGDILYANAENQPIEREQVYTQTALAAPYLGLLDEFSLEELIPFQAKFKPFQAGIGYEQVVQVLEFSKLNTRKQLKYFSSGMRQRVKLALAVLSDTSLLLLDEPTITLDKKACEWFEQLLNQYTHPKRTLVVASNVEADFGLCTQRLDILGYKT